MNKKVVYYIVEWVVAIAACGWLVWKMATYDDYAGLWAAISGMDCARVCALLICIALMPVNMTIEAWRWRTLMNGDASLNGANGGMIDWREAHRQVYYSKLAGLITPWRLGEYPARGVIMAEESQESRAKSQESVWPKVLSMGVVGSATMTMAIVIAGVAAITANGEWLMVNGEWWVAVVVVVILLSVGLGLASRLLRRWAIVSHGLIIKSVGQSMVRLLCWCVQLVLVLWALGGLGEYNGEWLMVNGEWLFKTPIYYLLVTITPNVPIAEVGVRGAWAITVFGTMNAAFAGVLLWGINTLLPCLIWPFLRKNA